MLKRREVTLFGKHYYWFRGGNGQLVLRPDPIRRLPTRGEVAAWLAREAGLPWVR